ncbi:hypothetical protein [Parasedimentitalea psychrophila]|uniref:Uncharacterized protein n=1 Tax=Parasedimentitalea psychrophila TaxID=2997337 RepID=A0A9Y2P2G9_9RHOB|nr:hypothetical protein [Parasedimentitalea psychrophila]WIY25067.1 hypothetical protein QPJ95_21680 [Parasedimentitalea psychrophila]
MALTWPLPLSAFFDSLPVQRVAFQLANSVTHSETGGGEVISHRRGARLWTGKIILDKDYHASWAAIEARLSLLEEPGASFLLKDLRMPGPIADRDHSLLGAAIPKIATLDSNNREMTVKGLPPWYVVSQGDLLGFTYGTDPIRYAFHRVVTGGITDAFGITPNIEVTPFIRPGAQVNAVLTLGNPVLKAKITSAEYGNSRSIISEGGSINWTQTLR